MKVKFKVFLLAAVLLSVSVIGAVKGFEYFNTPDPGALPPGDTVFTVNPGDNVGTIGRRLEKLGLIRSAEFLKLYSRIKGTGGSFKTGSYRISPGAKMSDIHDILISGHQILYKVTIPEGWTMKRIGRLLEDEGITAAEDFYKAAGSGELLSSHGIHSSTAEGFLFPDTYMFQKNFPAERVVSIMIDNFFRIISEIYPDYREIPPDEFYRKIILASIVEREYRVADEAPLIAGVFYNRLKIGMSLGSCATVAYIITDIEGKPHPSRITYADLEIDSPYNTYLHKGLPPSPISNPGRTALEAAFHPAKTKYLFFVLEDPSSGRHKFTETYQDHLTAKNLYIKSK